jgi:biliverdin reductase/flavin reductase
VPSRELVAKLLVSSVSNPGMYGRTIDVLNGNETVEDEIRRVIKQDEDTWVGEG